MPYSSPAHDSQQQEAQRVNLATVVTDALLAVMKLVVGSLTFSNALIADGIHSLADLLTDIIVMGATHFGRRAPDDDHPYGHGRIETMASLWLGVVLCVVAGAMIWESAQRLWMGESVHFASLWAVAATLIALLAKEALFHWTMRIAKRQQSPLLEASAWHSRSDSLSSLIVLVGLIGTWFGWFWLDSLAALLVALLVAKIGFDTLWQAGRELIDTGLPEEQLAELRGCANDIPDLKDLHDLRARRIGGDISLDVHLQVESNISVTEAHEIGMAFTSRLRQQRDSLRDITFHIDYENDAEEEWGVTTQLMPLRNEITELLNRCWEGLPCWQEHIHLGLQYRRLRDKSARCIDLDIYLPPQTPEVPPATLRTLANNPPWLGDIRLWHASSQTQ
ncbi:cation diffusion facilitator family transporter [Carnimonas bestiolae]|uniref:cation diffusion facilitator family transporter n=1 Tax=Carnimonas bestiolae TaxID=3402172 RepID=UPI003EDC37BC